MTKIVCVEIWLSDSFTAKDIFGIRPEYWEYDFAKPVTKDAIKLLFHSWNCFSNIEDCGFVLQVVTEEGKVVQLCMKSDSKDFLDDTYNELRDFVHSQ